MKARIIITDEIITDAQAGGVTVTDQLATVYAGNIVDRVKEDPRLADLDAFQLAMVDAGITKHSRIDALYNLRPAWACWRRGACAASTSAW